MTRGPLLVLAALVVLAGCGTTTVAGTPQALAGFAAPPVHHVDANRVTSTDALGDITTVSACSLLDEKALAAKYGAYRLVAAPTIDDCALDVRAAGGGSLRAVVGTLEDYDRTPVTQPLPRTGGMRIIQEVDDATQCTAVLEFADGVAMIGHAVFSSGSGQGVACELVTTLLDQVVASVTGPGPRHREYATYSLSRLDACTLLGETEVKLFGGGEGHVQRLWSFPAHHRCSYGVTAAGTGGQVELVFSERTPGAIPPQWTQARVGGRASLVIPSTKPSPQGTYCIVSTEWTLLEDAGPVQASEAAAVTVRVPPGQPVPCDRAKKVAAAVWEKLP